MINEARDAGVEPFGIGEAIDHEAREHLVGVEDEQGTVPARVLDMDEAGAELLEQSLAMSGRGDDHRRLAGDQALVKEGGGGREQALVRGVELHGVVRGAVAGVRHQL